MTDCLCDIVSESADTAESVFTSIGTLLTATALAVGIYVPVLSTTFEDTAQASELVEDHNTLIFVDGAHAGEEVTQLARSSDTLLERARAGDLVLPIITDLAVESAAGGDWVVGLLRADLTDTALAGEQVLASAVAVALVDERAAAVDAILLAAAQFVEDGAQASEAAAGAARRFELAYDTASAGDHLEESSAAGELLADGATAGEQVFQRATGNQLVSDWAGADDEVLAGEGSSAWTCSTQSFGMSRLALLQVNSAAVVGGRLLVAGPGGLYAASGSQTQAMVKTGLTDFGSPSMKRATYAYVGYAGQPLTMDVGNTASGQEATYSYPIPARLAQAATPSRARLGRGAHSRYWRFTLNGTNFQLHDVELVIDNTSRKV